MKEIVKKYYLYGVIALIIIVVVIFFPRKETKKNIEFFPSSMDDKVEVDEYIYIDLKGQVQNPGVYKILKDSRLFQAVFQAGGTTFKADTLAINMALKLYDQQVIYIPSFEEGFPLISDISNGSSKLAVDINTASIDILDTLPGIGPSTAQSIVDYRIEHGFFESIEDIMNVTGIGEATFNEIKDLITV